MATEEEQFEADVLRVARALFGSTAQFQGAHNLNGRERDGLFVSADAVVVIECTISRRKEKAASDGAKLQSACFELANRHPMKLIKGYFVTRDEPTAMQRQVISRLRAPVVACSLQQFRA